MNSQHVFTSQPSEEDIKNHPEIYDDGYAHPDSDGEYTSACLADLQAGAFGPVCAASNLEGEDMVAPGTPETTNDTASTPGKSGSRIVDNIGQQPASEPKGRGEKTPHSIEASTAGSPKTNQASREAGSIAAVPAPGTLETTKDTASTPGSPKRISSTAGVPAPGTPETTNPRRSVSNSSVSRVVKFSAASPDVERARKNYIAAKDEVIDAVLSGKLTVEIEQRLQNKHALLREANLSSQPIGKLQRQVFYAMKAAERAREEYIAAKVHSHDKVLIERLGKKLQYLDRNVQTRKRRLSKSCRKSTRANPKSKRHHARKKQKLSSSGVEDNLSCVTLNIWSKGPYMLARMRAIAKMVCEENFDVVALQEVNRVSLGMLRSLLGDYNVVSPEATVEDSNGVFVVLFIHNRCEIWNEKYIPLPSQQLRGMVKCDVKFGQTFVAVGSVHFESYVNMSNPGEEARRLQIYCARTELNKCLDTQNINGAILLGDFNSKYGMPENRRYPLWKDIWEEKSPQDPGFTYDGVANDMVSNRFRYRFDRCLYRGTNIKARSCRLVAQEQIVPNLSFYKKYSNGNKKKVPLYMSDHFGVACTFDRK